MNATAATTPGTTGPAPLARPATVQVSTVSLLARARSLHSRAAEVNPILAHAYLRRAAELRMEAWARTARRAPAALEDFATAAA